MKSSMGMESCASVSGMSVEIICAQCGAETFLNREAVYEGFQKTGETLSCASCGFVYESEEEVPYKEKESAPSIFTDADRTAKVEVFSEGENKSICRYCANYVVNPFMQFCSQHKKEVQSTDSCSRFTESTEETSPENPLF